MYYFCNMIELSKHIEVLLLENDCVIVPGLGGFIAHKRQAAYSIQKGEFMPPLRTIGFNPQLIMNDGLLVQSYMQRTCKLLTPIFPMQPAGLKRLWLK